MSKTGKVLLTLLLLAGFAGALTFALRGQQIESAKREEAIAVASVTELTGLISLDVEPYFKDERVRAILAKHRLPVKTTRVGSREMPGQVVAGAMPDFMFPSGVVAANQIVDAARKANIAVVQSSPFHTHEGDVRPDLPRDGCDGHLPQQGDQRDGAEQRDAEGPARAQRGLPRSGAAAAGAGSCFGERRARRPAMGDGMRPFFIDFSEIEVYSSGNGRY